MSVGGTGVEGPGTASGARHKLLQGPGLFEFGRVRPMLAETASGPFSRAGWLFEVKWDGYRALAFLERDNGGGRTRLQSRNLRDLTPNYPELGTLHRNLAARSAIVDGEIVALRDGRPDFQTLQAGGRPVIYVAFDILAVDGEVLTGHPLGERRRLLEARLAPSEALILSGAVAEQGVEFYRAAVEKGLEGVIGKRADSAYLPGRRTRDWLKVRNVRRVLALVCGHSRGADARPFGSLILGLVGDDGHLHYAGHVGTGFDHREMRALLERLRPADRCPLAGGEPRSMRGRATWVEPSVVVEIEYLEWTRESRLRHPVYRGIRPDKVAGDCRLSQVGGDSG